MISCMKGRGADSTTLTESVLARPLALLARAVALWFSGLPLLQYLGAVLEVFKGEPLERVQLEALHENMHKLS